MTLRLVLFYFGVGNGYYFEVLVILERYADILNFKDERMIRIDENSKQPIKEKKVIEETGGSTQHLQVNPEDLS